MKKIDALLLIVGLSLLSGGVILTVLSYINITTNFSILRADPNEIDFPDILAVIGFLMALYGGCFHYIRKEGNMDHEPI